MVPNTTARDEESKSVGKEGRGCLSCSSGSLKESKEVFKHSLRYGTRVT